MKWGQLALCWLLAPRCQKELLRGTLGAQIVICLILLGYKLVKPDGCWHKSSFFKVELSISSQHEQQRNRPLTWAWTIRCQPSSVLRIFSAELHQLSPFQLLCPTMHTRTRDRCSQGSQQHLHIPLERKNEGIDGWVRNGQYCFLHVTFMRQFNTHKLCSLAAPLTSDQMAGKVTKGVTVPPRASLCTQDYIQLVLPHSNLSTLQLLCSCELVLQLPQTCFAVTFCQKRKAVSITLIFQALVLILTFFA